MAAVFRVTRNALLKRKNNIDTACGKLFDFIRRVATVLLFLDSVQKETLAHHIVCVGMLAASLLVQWCKTHAHAHALWHCSLCLHTMSRC